MSNRVGLMVLKCLLAMLVTTSGSTAAIEPAANDNEWHEIRSHNFVVVGDGREKQLRRVALDLEEVRRQLLRVVPLEPRSPASVTVVSLRNRQSFAALLQPDPSASSRAGFVAWSSE